MKTKIRRSSLLAFFVGTGFALAVVVLSWRPALSYPELRNAIATQTTFILVPVGSVAAGLSAMLLGTKAYWRGRKHLALYGLAFALVAIALACSFSARLTIYYCGNCMEAHVREGPFDRLQCQWNNLWLAIAGSLTLPPALVSLYRRARRRVA